MWQEIAQLKARHLIGEVFESSLCICIRCVFGESFKSADKVIHGVAVKKGTSPSGTSVMHAHDCRVPCDDSQILFLVRECVRR